MPVHMLIRTLNIHLECPNLQNIPSYIKTDTVKLGSKCSDVAAKIVIACQKLSVRGASGAGEPSLAVSRG